MPGAPYFLAPGSVTEGGSQAYVQPSSGSHWGFVFWMVVFVVAAGAILGGLQIGGFSFVFRHR